MACTHTVLPTYRRAGTGERSSDVSSQLKGESVGLLPPGGVSSQANDSISRRPSRCPMYLVENPLDAFQFLSVVTPRAPPSPEAGRPPASWTTKQSSCRHPGEDKTRTTPEDSAGRTVWSNIKINRASLLQQKLNEPGAAYDSTSLTRPEISVPVPAKQRLLRTVVLRKWGRGGVRPGFPAINPGKLEVTGKSLCGDEG